MASNVPASLKAADISRFAHRAAQLETVDPVIAYYCKYQVIQTILGKSLERSSEEATTYTTNMIEQLEQFKAEHPTEEAVTDDTVGKIYVEQFGLKTFRRADTAMKADKATPQTADTFQAAATFLDLLSIWGKIDPEVMAKIKYAKFHALRIAKAIRAGEDPNLSNPKPDPEVEGGEQQLPALDANDPEVQMLNAGSGGSNLHRQPSVVDAPDETDRMQRNLAARTLTDESLHPSRAPSIPRPGQPSVAGVVDESHLHQHNMAAQSATNESLHPSRTPSVPPGGGSGGDVSPPAANDPASYYTNATDQPDVSPLEPTPAGRAPSLGGNYFPPVPPPFSQPPPASTDIPSAPITREDTDLPSAPPHIQTSNLSSLPTAPSEPTLPDTPASLSQIGAFDPQPARKQSPTIPPTHHGHFLPQPQPGSGLPQIPPNFTPQSAPRQPVPQAPPQLRHPATLPAEPSRQQQQQPVHTAAAVVPPPPANVVVDEEAIMKAQKHARWAISALNFEDVGTAIRELKGALETLGAR